MTNLFRTRQPFLQSNSWQNQALNALHYNTSQQGSVVPLVYGTTRVQVNIIDLLNYMGPQGKKGKTGSIPITGTPQTGKGGGSSKGKGGKKQVDFSVDVMFAVCQGEVGNPINIYASAGVEGFASSGLTFQSGADGQGPNSIFNGLGHSVGYSGTAVFGGHMDLGQSPVVPNLSVEIPGLLAGNTTGSYTNDANPGLIIADFLLNPRYGAEWPSANLSALTGANSYANYCAAAQLLVSVEMDGHQKAIDWVDQLVKLTNSALVWAGKLLYIIPYGDLSLNSNGTTWDPVLTPVYSVNDNDFIPWHPVQDDSGPKPGEEDPILVTHKNPADKFNWQMIEYTDSSNFYNSTTLSVSDQGYIDQFGLRIGDTVQGRAFTNQTSAQISIQLALQRSIYVANTPYRFQLSWKYGLIIPMDIIELTGRFGDTYLNAQPVRITKVEEDENGVLICEAEEIQIGASPPAPAPINLSIDPAGGTSFAGVAANLTFAVSVTPTALVLVTTTRSNGLIGADTVSSVTDDHGLSWNKRTAFNHTILNSGSPIESINMEIWYADARSLGTTTTINVTVDYTSGAAYFPMAAVLFIRGDIDYSTIFDSNSSVPVKTTNTLTIPIATGISTSSPNAILIAFIATTGSGTPANINKNFGSSWVTLTSNTPVWDNNSGGPTFHYGIGAIIGTGDYANLFGVATQQPRSGISRFSGYTATPFAQNLGTTSINSLNAGYMLIVDAIAGT